jgi:hypothetical protein
VTKAAAPIRNVLAFKDIFAKREAKKAIAKRGGNPGTTVNVPSIFKLHSIKLKNASSTGMQNAQ